MIYSGLSYPRVGHDRRALWPTTSPCVRLAQLISYTALTIGNGKVVSAPWDGDTIRPWLSPTTATSTEKDSVIQTTSLNDALAQISRLSEDIKILSNEIQLLNNLLDSKEAEIASNKIELGELGDRLNRVLTSELYKLQKYKSEFFGQLSETLGQREDIQIKGEKFILTVVQMKFAF